MNPNRSPRYGVYTLIALIPLAALSLYPAFLHYLGLSKEYYALFHNRQWLPVYITLLIVSMALPFAVFLIVRKIHEHGRKKLALSGLDAAAKIVKITPTGVKLTEGVTELWGVMLELVVTRPGKIPIAATVEHYVPVMEIPLFQPGMTIEVKVNPENDNEIVIIQ